MKKTNVMIEVSEDLYNEVVEPYKKKKGFGKLVVQLLEAYRTNDSIYSYINGTMDGLESEATEELLKDLNNMAQSLNMFGVLHNQAEVVIDEGKRTFNDFSNQANEDINKFGSGNVPPKEEPKETLTKEDVVSIVNDSISDIKSMLKDLLDSKDVSAPVVEKVQEQVHEVVESKINTDLSSVVTNKNSSPEVYSHVVEKKVSEKDEEEANSAIQSLIGSLNF